MSEGQKPPAQAFLESQLARAAPLSEYERLVCERDEARSLNEIADQRITELARERDEARALIRNFGAADRDRTQARYHLFSIAILGLREYADYLDAEAASTETARCEPCGRPVSRAGDICDHCQAEAAGVEIRYGP